VKTGASGADQEKIFLSAPLSDLPVFNQNGSKEGLCFYAPAISAHAAKAARSRSSRITRNCRRDRSVWIDKWIGELQLADKSVQNVKRIPIFDNLTTINTVNTNPPDSDDLGRNGWIIITLERAFPDRMRYYFVILNNLILNRNMNVKEHILNRGKDSLECLRALQFFITDIGRCRVINVIVGYELVYDMLVFLIPQLSNETAGYVFVIFSCHRKISFLRTLAAFDGLTMNNVIIQLSQLLLLKLLPSVDCLSLRQRPHTPLRKC